MWDWVFSHSVLLCGVYSILVYFIRPEAEYGHGACDVIDLFDQGYYGGTAGMCQ